MSALRHITFYGKRASASLLRASQNALAALVELGQKLLIVGCDPKVDSTRPILKFLKLKVQDTVLHLAAKEGSVEDFELENVPPAMAA